MSGLAAIADPISCRIGQRTRRHRGRAVLGPTADDRGGRPRRARDRGTDDVSRGLAIAAIERGIAVLIEKPIAATVEGGIRIAAAASLNEPR